MGSSISQNNKEKASRETEVENKEEEDEGKDSGRNGDYGNHSAEERVSPDDEDEEFEYETEDTDSEEKMQAEESDKKDEEGNEKQQNVKRDNDEHDDIQNDDLEEKVRPVKKEEMDESKDKREDRSGGEMITDEPEERSSNEIIEREEYDMEEDTAHSQREISAAEGRIKEEEKKVKGSNEQQDTDGSKKSVIKKLKDKMVAARVGIHWENVKKGKHIDQKDEETQVDQVNQLWIFLNKQG